MSFIFNSSFEVEAAASSTANPSVSVSANPSTIVEAIAAVEAAKAALAKAVRCLETAMEVQVVTPLETDDESICSESTCSEFKAIEIVTPLETEDESTSLEESPLNAIQIDVPKSHANAPVRQRNAVKRAARKEAKKAVKGEWASARSQRSAQIEALREAQREAERYARYGPSYPVLDYNIDRETYSRSMTEYQEKRKAWWDQKNQEEAYERQRQAQAAAQAEANQVLARAIGLAVGKEMDLRKHRRM